MALSQNATQNPLNVRHPDYDAQADQWETMEDFYLGADNVRSKGVRYLPTTEVEEAEIKKLGSSRNEATTYSRRLQRSPFFNGISRLARYAMGHIFRVAPLFQGTMPEGWEKIKVDCDLLGSPIESFIQNVSKLSYVMGHHFVMVDMPNTGAIDSRSVQKIVNPRPYLVSVNAQEIINWSISRSLDGSFEFDWLVHRYAFYESVDPTSTHRYVVYYKVWWKDKWELYRVELQADSEDLDQATPVRESGGTNPLGIVPYVPFYTGVIRPMVSQPTLSEAASLNRDHYCTFSDFMHGLRYHLSPIFVTTGTQENTVNRNAASGLALPRNATAEYVETTGNGLKIALETADRIANEMWEAGMRSSAAVGANTSAEARKLARGDFFSFLTSVVASHQHSWAKVFKLINAWNRSSIENELPVKLNDDFDVAQLEANQAEFLLNARKAGEISKELFLTEAVRGGVLKADLDIEKEMLMAKKDLKDDLEVLAAAEAASQPATPAGPGPKGTPAPKPQKEPAK